MGRKHRVRIERTLGLLVRKGHLTPEELAESEAMGFTPELAEYKEPVEAALRPRVAPTPPPDPTPDDAEEADP